MALSPDTRPASGSELEDEEVDEAYEVESIKSWRYNLNTKRKEFLIKWIGYPEDDNTWEPEEHLDNCRDKLKKFRKKLPTQELEYLNSKHPERLTGLQRNADINSMYGKLERDNSTENKVVVYLTFEDEPDTFEKVNFEVLREYRPDKAFEFIEQRLIDKRAQEIREG